MHEKGGDSQSVDPQGKASEETRPPSASPGHGASTLLFSHLPWDVLLQELWEVKTASLSTSSQMISVPCVSWKSTLLLCLVDQLKRTRASYCPSGWAGSLSQYLSRWLSTDSVHLCTQCLLLWGIVSRPLSVSHDSLSAPHSQCAVQGSLVYV